MADGLLSIFLIVPFLFLAGVTSRNITIENKCDYTVWPGTYSMNEPSLSTTGFVLRKGEARVINTPSSWNGRFWGRSLCSTNTTGWFSCITGDCGSGEIECSGAAATPPATLVELSLDVYNGQDFYDVSVVDGYNLPVILAPQGGQGCRSVGCAVDLNKTCPTELKVGVEQPVACMSACQAFKSPIFCCANRTEKCQSTLYSQNFKRECPLAYSYGSDDATSTFTCPNSAEYVIRFCPSTIPNMTKNNNSSSVFPAQTPSKSPFPAPTTLEPPSQSQPPKEATTEAKEKRSWKLKLILGVSSAAIVVMILIMVVIIARARNAKEIEWSGENIVMMKRYSYSNIKKMTNSFAHVLGKGGFGTVYKGKLPDGNQDVAVKILMQSKGNGEDFMNELASMSRTSHVNIVSLLGFCYEGNKRAIVYEFMPNGSLDKFISAKLEWEKLYDISLGVSRGLEYLHNRCVSRIVHFDIKPQNILMDKDLCPKISDFGLAKLCKNKESIISMVDARGTVGYIAPEVFSKNFGGVSHKSDVYSYGMVVLDMIGARNIEKVEHSGSNNSSMYFPDWIYKDFERGEIMRIFGDQITEDDEKIAKKLLLVGLWCIQTNPSHRPAMIKVIEMLEGSLEGLQVPPKPILCLPPTVTETIEGSNETSSFTNSSQNERGTLSDNLRFSNKDVFEPIVGSATEESQNSLRSSSIEVNKESGSLTSKLV